MVLDLRQRFYCWAAEYIKASDITLFPQSELLAFLVENKVFTFEELRREFDARKIIVHENVFELAKKTIKEKKTK